jgi:hypothetical protein
VRLNRLPHGHRAIMLGPLAVLLLAAVTLAVSTRVDAADLTAAGPASDGQWPARGDLVGDRGLIAGAVHAWDASRSGGPVTSVRVLLAESDPALGSVVILEGSTRAGLQVATMTGLRGETASNQLELRDERGAADLATQPGLAMLVDTPEDAIDGSRVTIVLARPGASVERTVSSAFDTYGQGDSAQYAAISVVPADATEANSAALIDLGTTRTLLPFQSASTDAPATVLGQARIDYLPVGYQATGGEYSAAAGVTTRSYANATGATLAITETRGADLTPGALLEGLPGDVSQANPHVSAPMAELNAGSRWAFAWTTATHTLGYSVVATSGDAQIAAYHVAQGMETP